MGDQTNKKNKKATTSSKNRKSRKLRRSLPKNKSKKEQLVSFGQELNLQGSEVKHISQPIFESYFGIWKKLQALRLAAEDLWDLATPEALLVFTAQLRDTYLTVRQGEIFFSEKDRQNLLRLLSIFGDYRIGKERLISIRHKEDIKRGLRYGPNFTGAMAEQIIENSNIKNEYEDLLENVRSSFAKRLYGYYSLAIDTNLGRSLPS